MRVSAAILESKTSHRQPYRLKKKIINSLQLIWKSVKIK